MTDDGNFNISNGYFMMLVPKHREQAWNLIC